MSIEELGILLSCLMPLAKIGEGRYMIGVEAKSIIIKLDRILVQVSSSFIELRKFIERYNLSNCLVIWRTMQIENISYREAVLNLLKAKGAKPKLIAKYDKEITD